MFVLLFSFVHFPFLDVEKVGKDYRQRTEEETTDVMLLTENRIL